MAKCHRGSIPRNVERDLYGRSGGYCSNPDCRASLIIETAGGRTVAIGEMAHVIAWSPDGPRGGTDGRLSESLNEVENLVLLCPNCHTVVDGAPDDYPVETLIAWREERTSLIRQLAARPIFKERQELVEEIRKLQRASKAIHETYGPESELAADPGSGAAETWRREAVRVIVPNNSRIWELAEANSGLLGSDELLAIDRFRVHADGFAYNQLSGDKDENVPRYPREMEVFER